MIVFLASNLGAAETFAEETAQLLTLLNERDGGVGGEKITVPECETAYNTEKGVECYEATKGSGALASGTWRSAVKIP